MPSLQSYNRSQIALATAEILTPVIISPGCKHVSIFLTLLTFLQWLTMKKKTEKIHVQRNASQTSTIIINFTMHRLCANVPDHLQWKPRHKQWGQKQCHATVLYNAPAVKWSNHQRTTWKLLKYKIKRNRNNCSSKWHLSITMQCGSALQCWIRDKLTENISIKHSQIWRKWWSLRVLVNNQNA